MPALVREQENQVDILNWFLTVNGVLTDAYSMEYRVFDITGGLPGTQVFPTTPGQYENVTNAPGKFGTGSYYAYDNTNLSGYTPPITASVGTHRVEWRWKISDIAPYQSGFEDFEILVQPSGGFGSNTYITIQDVRDAGLSATDYSDAEVLAAIEVWQTFLDRACRQWFLPKEITMELDGTDSDMLHLGVPIIELEYLKLNGSDDELDTSYYKVYNGITYPDDRKNPRIKLLNNQTYDIFSQNYDFMVFRKGYKNQILKGTFGYVESDLSPPKLIQRALLKLVVEKLTNPVYGEVDENLPSLVGNLIEEWTDGHKIKYAQSGGEYKPRPPGLLGITEDAEILQIIKLYKGPLAMAYPINDSIR